MGYRARVYKLTWPAGHEFEDLEIRLSGLTMEELDKVMSVDDLPENASKEERKQAIRGMIEVFSEHLLSWNYEDINGNPVGTTPAEVARVDMRVLLPAARRWSQEVSNIPAPLPESSPNGQQSAAPPAVMDLPLPDPLSSPTPN